MLNEGFLRDFFHMPRAATKQPRPRWEYLRTTLGRADLDRIGNDGWELVTTYDDHQGEYPGRLTLVFKRRK